jgi:NADH-quinone oxidoreductase subunit L
MPAPDAVLEHVQQAAFGGEFGAASGAGIPGWAAWTLYLSLLLTTALTAAYALRAWLMTFFGPARRAHEAPGAMRWPVIVLAGASAVLGFLGLAAEELRPHLGAAAMALLFTAAGAGTMLLLWRDAPAADPAERLRRLRPLLENAFYLDALYDRVVVRPVRWLGRVVRGTDTRVLDGAVMATGPAARGLGALTALPQTGNPQTYLTGLLAGAVFLVLAVVALT